MYTATKKDKSDLFLWSTMYGKYRSERKQIVVEAVNFKHERVVVALPV